MLEMKEISEIIARFGLTAQKVTAFYDTSHGDDDRRLNYILDDKYVLKVNSLGAMWEDRLAQIHRLILRYRSIGLYCPELMPTVDGELSCRWRKDGRDPEYICFVEEFAKYPLIGDDEDKFDRNEVIEHLGILAARYSGVELSDIRSMWSIIDLAPLDVDIDEKQENANTLVAALHKNGYDELADRVDSFNRMLRERIMTVFDRLPRCVYQGDLNSSNELQKDGHFVGLIDFNMSGTDVNINVFANETDWFPTEAEFDALSVQKLLSRAESEQNARLAVILRHYELNEDEIYAMPYYRRIVDMFQYPNVCAMVRWLGDDSRKEKCIEMIEALMAKEL